MLEFIDKPGFLIVALLAIVMFGAKRLPESARSLGRSMRILKAETKGLHDDHIPTAALTTTPPAAPVTAPVTAAAPAPAELP